MNYTLRNIVGTVLILFALAFGYYYLFSRQKGQYIPDNWGDLGCMYPTNISSDSLEPTLIKGSLLILNQCIKSNTSLNEGDVVLFNNDVIYKYIKLLNNKYDSISSGTLPLPTSLFPYANPISICCYTITIYIYTLTNRIYNPIHPL